MLFSLFVVGFTPSLSDRPLHILVSLFVHLLHHVHYSSTRVLLFLLLLFLLFP